MTLTSYKYKLQFVYDIINGKQSIADARKIFSDEWAAFYGLYVNISAAEQKLGELDTFMHGMNAYSVQIAQKFFETQRVEIYNKLEEYYDEGLYEWLRYLMYYDEEFLSNLKKDISVMDYYEELISDPKKDISVKCIEDLMIHSDPEDVQNIRDAYFKSLDYVERNPYIRSIKRNAFNAFLKKWNYI